MFTETDPKPNSRLSHWSPPPDDDIRRFDELMDELDCAVNTDDYNAIPLLRPTPVEPTFSVVEVPPASPDLSAEGANAQTIPDTTEIGHRKCVKLQKLSDTFSYY